MHTKISVRRKPTIVMVATITALVLNGCGVPDRNILTSSTAAESARVTLNFDYEHLKVAAADGAVEIRISVKEPSVIQDLDQYFAVVSSRRVEVETDQGRVEEVDLTDVSTSGKPAVLLRVEALDAAKVYQFEVRVHKRNVDGSSTPVAETMPVYYAIPTGPSKLERGRADIVSIAIYEWAVIGKREAVTVDQNRYQAGNNAWCSEFYSWVTDQRVEHMGFRPDVASLRSFFKRYSRMADGPEIATLAEPGDYLAMWGNEHSGMFLAIDQARGHLWSLDGNWGDKTRILRRDFNTQDFDLGVITAAMIEEGRNADTFVPWVADRPGC